MPPVKFDDIPKVATEVLTDDYVSSYQLKAKQKTTWDGATATTTVDVKPGEAVATPAKLSWKFPKPFGIAGVCIDKLDFAKDGKYALEATCDKALHSVDGLTVTTKSDLTSMVKASVGCTYTGVKATQIKLDTKLEKIPDSVCMEITHALPTMTIGTKFSKKNVTAPDIGVRFTSGPLFGAFTALDSFKKFSFFTMYKLQDDVKLAATCTYKGALSSYTVGAVYDVKPGIKVKGKFEKGEKDKDPSVSLGIKYEVSKGFTTTFGCKSGIDFAKPTYGFQVSVE